MSYPIHLFQMSTSGMLGRIESALVVSPADGFKLDDFEWDGFELVFEWDGATNGQ